MFTISSRALAAASRRVVPSSTTAKILLDSVASVSSAKLFSPTATMSTTSAVSKLEEKNMNQSIVKAEYAVRGELVIRADAYRAKIAKEPTSHGLPFNKVIACNIGNPQELGQKPITFFRQVLSLCQYPDLLKSPYVNEMFAEDAIKRAKFYLSNISSTGSYTHSKGLGFIRDEVAAFIGKRDGVATNPENIFLTDGASSGVKTMLNMIIANPTDGVMCPIPQYPLYSASMTLFGGQLVPYYLNEEKGWGLDVSELEASLAKARAAGTNVRSIVIINPGNPTGQCLTYENIKAIVQFCIRENLIILADEVYQTNIYSDIPFTSFRKVVKELGDEGKNAQLVSFHSVSKGFLGECGQRGGYFHTTHLSEGVLAQLYKMASVSLCSNVSGQLMVGLMCNPPVEGDASYKQYVEERDSILDSLRRRAVKLAAALNKLEGVSCQPVAGAMYAFPQITLPPRALEEAKAKGKPADALYAIALLDATGICVVPGTGFSQVPGTFHYRTTILPPEDDMDRVIDLVAKFHADYMAKYK